jgi:hypothetical protein
MRQNSRVLWLGNMPELQIIKEKKKDKTRELALLTFYERTEDVEIKVSKEIGQWLIEYFPRLSVTTEQPVLFKELMQNFPVLNNYTFEQFLESQAWKNLRAKGLILV